MVSESNPAISRLTCLEFHCAVKRKQRSGNLSEQQAGAVTDMFNGDLADGLFVLYPVRDNDYLLAQELLNELESTALRALDALHLSIARAHHHTRFATADQGLSAAALQLGLHPLLFNA